MSFDPTGYTLAHEHLHIDLSGFKNNVDCRLDQYAFICQEMNDLMTRGVRNVIEMTNRYMGRNAQFMLDVMRETGINVVACTGYYQDAFFPEHVATRSVQELAQEMVDEIEQGIDGTELKAGIIAEIGTSEGKITPLEEKVFIAAALAHNQTGRPISTHTSFSTMGLEQLALLQAHGVDLFARHRWSLRSERQPRQHFEDDRSRRVRAVRHHRQEQLLPGRKAYCDASCATRPWVAEPRHAVDGYYAPLPFKSQRWLWL